MLGGTSKIAIKMHELSERLQVWKKEEKSCGDHEVGMLKIFGTVIYNIKNTVNITENPI
jgi:hypothetical protein